MPDEFSLLVPQDVLDALERGKRLNDTEDVEPFFIWAHRVDQWIYNDLPVIEKYLLAPEARVD
jgi:hypothetical protein